jgi:AbrB family looped-hinge helix DNA binding protein
MEITAKIGFDGRLAVPASFRKKLHLSPGDEVIMRLEDEELHIFTLQHALKKARAIIAKHTKGGSLVEKLKQQRQEDLANE